MRICKPLKYFIEKSQKPSSVIMLWVFEALSKEFNSAMIEWLISGLGDSVK
nr:hypothetical protein [Tanacetum cinerariifolium]